jgi:hypothetical protein
MIPGYLRPGKHRQHAEQALAFPAGNPCGHEKRQRHPCAGRRETHDSIFSQIGLIAGMLVALLPLPRHLTTFEGASEFQRCSMGHQSATGEGRYLSCERSRVVSWPSAKVTMTLARPPMAPR